MLVPRRLDDQTYAEIVAEAEARLPWLCPAWTDHNAHDPGITVLELMAWYKELQQYQMDQITRRSSGSCWSWRDCASARNRRRCAPCPCRRGRRAVWPESG